MGEVFQLFCKNAFAAKEAIIYKTLQTCADGIEENCKKECIDSNENQVVAGQPAVV